jgi:hypothetical protein
MQHLAKYRVINTLKINKPIVLGNRWQGMLLLNLGPRGNSMDARWVSTIPKIIII